MPAEKVIAILADVLGVEPEIITLESNLISDLGAESIDFVDIVFGLEQEFKLKIMPGDIFPQFLKDVKIFEDDGSIVPSVKQRIVGEYPHIPASVIEAFGEGKKPEIFFQVGIVDSFIARKLN